MRPVETPSDAARRALELWAAFPAGRQPRPLVLTGETWFFDYDSRSDPDRLSVFDITLTPEADLPVEVREVSSRFGHIHTMAPLRVERAARAPGRFDTDRGPRDLPAWWLLREGQDVPLVVLAPEVVAAAWRPDGLSGRDNRTRAVLGANGRTVTLSFEGSPAAYTDYPGAVVLESASVVVIEPVSVELTPPDQPRLAFVEWRQVTASLAQPLGPRVLVGATGLPIAVTDTPFS